MARNSIIIIVVITIMIVTTTAYGFYAMDNPGTDGNPQIQVIPSSHNFGTIPKEAVSHAFAVNNIGTGTLEIKKVSTSCACTTAEIDSGNIEPGQSANMLVTFDPNAMDEIEENVFRIVYVKSNDPEHPEVEIEIRARVIGGKNV